MRQAFLFLALAGCVWAQGSPRARTFDFTYAVTVRAVPAGSRLRLWIPEATSNAWQQVRVLSTAGNLGLQARRETVYGDRMLYALVPRAAGAYHATIRYRVTRYERRSPAADPPDSAPSRLELAHALEANRLVPITGLPAQLAARATAGHATTRGKAHAIYDYVLAHMRYDKSGTGWGHGDVLFACSAHRGNCTDFHSLFIAMARSQKIPARFEIGFAIPTGSGGVVPGYHCWADFYLPGRGWVPIDAAEAWEEPSERNFLFGHLDANRVEFSSGRDLVLSPPQAGPPVNYFVYPYAEVNGKPVAVQSGFAYRELPPASASALASGR